MTVEDLIEKLRSFNPELNVFVAGESGIGEVSSVDGDVSAGDTEFGTKIGCYECYVTIFNEHS